MKRIWSNENAGLSSLLSVWRAETAGDLPCIVGEFHEGDVGAWPRAKLRDRARKGCGRDLEAHRPQSQC